MVKIEYKDITNIISNTFKNEIKHFKRIKPARKEAIFVIITDLISRSYQRDFITFDQFYFLKNKAISFYYYE